MKVIFYQTARGRSPVVDDIDSLPTEAAAHAYQLLEEVEEHGFNAPRLTFRHMQGKIWEIKMILPGIGAYRIFYFIAEGSTMVLLHAYSKKTKKAPRRHIETAIQRMAEAIQRGGL